MKGKVLFAFMTAAFIVGCAKKDDPAPAAPPPGQKATSTQEFKVGAAGSPATNNIQVADTRGGVVFLNWRADQDGRIRIENNMTAAIGCEISTLTQTYTLTGPGYAGQALQFPQEFDVKSGQDYSIKFELGANTCMGYSTQLSAAWIAVAPPPPPTPTPAPTPVPPVRPTPPHEPGFQGESELGSSGGSLVVNNPSEDDYYRDYYFEVTSTQRFYQNARAGASSCTSGGTVKLELLEISAGGTISARTKVAMGAVMQVDPGKYYRLRWSVSGAKGCTFVSESFNVGWL